MKQSKLPKRRFFHHDLEKESEVKTGISMTIFSMTNLLVGTGFVAVPYAFRESGYGLGVILIIFIAALSDYSVQLAVRSGELCKKCSYQDVAHAAFGLPAYITLIVFQITDILIGLVYFNILLGDNISKLLVRVTDVADIDELQDNFWGRREFVIAAAIILVAFPLSLYRNVAFIAKWAVLAVLGSLTMLVIFFVRLGTLDLPDTPDAYEFTRRDFIQAIGIFSALFVITPGAFLLRNSMSNPTDKRWHEVSNLSIFFGLALFVTIGTVGYVTFTDDVQGNLLQNYCHDDDLANVARGLFTVSILIVYPMLVAIVRESLEFSMFPSHQPAPLYRHFIMTAIIIAVGYAGALTTECLGIVLELDGILISTPLAFLFPVLFTLKLQKRPLRSWKNAPMFLVIIYVIGFMGSGLGYTIEELISGELQCTSGAEPAFCFKNLTSVPINGSLVP